MKVYRRIEARLAYCVLANIFTPVEARMIRTLFDFHNGDDDMPANIASTFDFLMGELPFTSVALKSVMDADLSIPLVDLVNSTTLAKGI